MLGDSQASKIVGLGKSAFLEMITLKKNDYDVCNCGKNDRFEVNSD